MPTVTYIEADGREHIVTVKSGTSARDAALNNNVPNLDGDCGGVCACATCHVYFDERWIKKIGTAPPESAEESLLQFAEDCRDSSRLACQIVITDDLDGLVLRLPAGQH